MNFNPKKVSILGALFSFLSVLLGAFGAHALKKIRQPDLIEVWQTATHYLGFHGLALLLISILLQFRLIDRPRCASLITLGTLIFSGSLFILVLSEIRTLGAITPIGGVLILAGWGVLIFDLNRGSKT